RPLLSDAELHRLLADWNPGETPARPLPPVHRLIEQQAAVTPDAVAIESPAGSVTYRALELRARDIAVALARLGAGPERTVAVMASRDAATVAAIVGIMKTGAAYVPLDPSSPPDRAAAIVAAAQPAAVLVPEHAAGFPAPAPVLRLGPDG